MEQTVFTVRAMQVSDIESAMKLSTAEGWNQTEKDWQLLVDHPGNVCILAEFGSKIIGTTTAIMYSNHLAWIGMVLVDKQFRGQGASKLLLTTIFKKLELFSIKLDATPAGQQVYRSFDFHDEYHILRMVNTSARTVPLQNDNDVSEPMLLEDSQEIIALDEVSFGINRTQLIQFLLTEYPGKTELLKRNERITGFALGRNGNRYHHIGPVVALSSTDAKILISIAINKLANQPVVIDVSEDKEDLIAWLSSIGFVQQRYFIRMYKNENTFPGATAKQFCIAGPEYG